MSFDVQIELSGMCLFHYATTRQGGSAEEPPKKAVTVLLVNATSAASGKPVDDCRKQGMSKLHRHEPYLSLRKTDVKSGSACDHPTEKGDWLICPIGGKKVTVGSGDGAVEVPSAPIQGRYDKPYMNGDEKECQWIVDLRRALRGGEVSNPNLKQECLHKSIPNPSVIARVHLTEGKLESSGIGMASTGRPIVWYFRDDPGDPNEKPHAQALTELVRLVVPDVSDGFIIKLTDANGRSRTVTLAPSDGQPLRVRIENRFVAEDAGYRPLHLHHFRWLYNLVEQCPAKLPAPFSTKSPVDMVRPWLVAGNAFCPPASWDDS